MPISLSELNARKNKKKKDALEDESKNIGDINESHHADEPLSLQIYNLEIKVDKILKYEKSMHGYMVLKGIISFIMFFVFILLPIIGGWYFFSLFADKIDITQIKEQYSNYQKLLKDGPKGFEGMNNLAK